MMRTFTIGLDFGTSSARALVVDCADGQVAGTSVYDYRAGERGVLLDPRDPHLARQHPADYLAGLREAIGGALAQADAAPGFTRDRVAGIGVAATASTPLPLDAQARPLALDPRWADDLSAQAWLWKDHTAAEQAAAITATARAHAPELLAPIGGSYSSEWFWSKIWRCLIVAPEVFDAAASWVELCDFLPAVLCGVDDPRAIVRSVCAAGHKALYSDAWGGPPPAEFLARLDPRLAALRDRLYAQAYPADRPVGGLSEAWAATLGLRPGIAIAMGGIDAHYGAVGAGARVGTLVKIVGTSTCDCAIAPLDQPMPEVPGICGIVPGSILPGHYGLEAGQAAVGDVLDWFVDRVCQGDDSLHAQLSAEAAELEPGESGLLALDWNNGNRNVLADPKLTGLIVGQTLRTTRAELYRALIEATAFGARTILERLTDHGILIGRIVCCGGIAEKNPLFMQIYADVLRQPMLMAGATQSSARGAAIAAAVAAGEAAGGADLFEVAQSRMVRLQERFYAPRTKASAVYDELYALYRELHDTFGAVPDAPMVDLGRFMKQLLALREQALTSSLAVAPATLADELPASLGMPALSARPAPTRTAASEATPAADPPTDTEVRRAGA